MDGFTDAPAREQLVRFVFDLLSKADSPEDIRALFDVIWPKPLPAKFPPVRTRRTRKL